MRPAIATMTAVAVALCGARADAKMMWHFDLAGLIRRADTVVVAERLGPGRYRVVRVLRGTGGEQPGSELAVSDSIYDTTGHKLDATVVLFLAHRDGVPELVGSGLRVLEHGKVFRFEQRDNPGPFEMVPQGRDPQDQWLPDTPQLDLPGLERAIAAAGQRVVALDAVAAAPDPAARRSRALALMPPPGDSTSAGGFYNDVLAGALETQLAADGDLEGALMIDARDRSAGWQHVVLATPAQLIAYAADPTHDARLRAGAIAATGRAFGPTDPTVARAIIPLIADPIPEVRAAAVLGAARPANESDSAPATEAMRKRLVAEARTAIAARYAVETDDRVLAAIAEAFRGAFQARLPARAGKRFVAAVHIDRGYLDVKLYCLAGDKITAGSLAATPAGGGAAVTPSRYNIAAMCAEGSASSGGSGTGPALPAGRYALAANLAVGRTHEVVPLGALVIDAAGDIHLTP